MDIQSVFCPFLFICHFRWFEEAMQFGNVKLFREITFVYKFCLNTTLIFVCFCYFAECSSPIFEEFLDLIGQKVRLKGFQKYRGGLDCKSKCI